MNINFTHIKILNFCGVGKLDIDLYERTIIKGVNASGKSTIKNAIYWVLFDKLADGSSATGIRPHDEFGNDINMIDISVELTMETDGKVILVSKTQKQNWVTDRTTREQTFKGNVNEYEINGIPKKQKDFFEYMNQYIDPDVFMFCTNPQVFLKMDTKNRRAKLFDLVGDVDSQVIEMDEAFAPIADDLKDGTIEELMSRANKAKKELTKQLELIPARVDELSHQLVDVDVDELNQAKTGYENAIKAEEKKIADMEVIDGTYDETRKRLLGAERDLMGIEMRVKSENDAKLAGANLAAQKLRQAIAVENSKIISNDTALKMYASEKTKYEKELESQRSLWEAQNALEFDDSELNCPTCGAPYSADKAEELRENFKKNKKSQLKKLEDSANSVKEMLESIDSKVSVINEENETYKANIEKMTTEMAEAEKTASEFKPVDITSVSDYKKALKTVETLKKTLADMDNNSGDKQTCLNKIETMNKAIAEIKVQLAKEDNNIQVKARMAELGEEQIKTSQKIATQEQMLDLLKEFNKKRIDFATEKINSYFSVIKWQMFKEQINGDYAEVCIPIVCTDNSNATSYDGLLNHGNKIIADIDLCQAFQKSNDVTCPIIIDDSESVDEWRIPNTNNQLIVLRRTDDKTLTVEKL